MRLSSDKLAGILTYFQRKVNTKFLLMRLPAALRSQKYLAGMRRIHIICKEKDRIIRLTRRKI
jgi:hypothetical protein